MKQKEFKLNQTIYFIYNYKVLKGVIYKIYTVSTLDNPINTVYDVSVFYYNDTGCEYSRTVSINNIFNEEKEATTYLKIETARDFANDLDDLTKALRPLIEYSRKTVNTECKIDLIEQCKTLYDDIDKYFKGE